jgi:hypothetical protein
MAKIRSIPANAGEANGKTRCRAARKRKGDTGGRREIPKGVYGIGRRLKDVLLTVRYHAFEAVTGLVETRPPPGRRLARALLRALGFRTPRVTSSITILREVKEVTRAFRNREEAVNEREQEATLCFSNAPGGRGTEVLAVVKGPVFRRGIKRLAGKVLAQPTRRRLRRNLRQVKQWLEAGEIATIMGQPSGRQGR